MALRNYMQDLLRAQSVDESLEEENGCTVNITIVDDNSSSCLPDDDSDVYDLPLGNLSFSNGMRSPRTPRTSLNGSLSSSIGVHGRHGFLLIERRGDSEELSRGETNRIMLDDFRRRQRYLRETLSPKRLMSSLPNLKFSPPPIHTLWTPPSSQIRRKSYADDSSEELPRDSQRGRMRRLKAQRNSSLPLV